MRKEFNELVETMKRWDLFQKDDEVDMALNDLGAKIDEAEKRMECAIRSAKEINKTISKYTEEIDDELPIKMSVNDHDLIQNCSDDVRIALDLNDDMSIVDNWYNLFVVNQEPKPIAVGNVEYDFPEEVYTIGNLDNTEIVGDVYESVFNQLLNSGALICEGDEGYVFGKANYMLKVDYYLTSFGLVIANQIDLSKVPIKREVFMTFESSWGEIDCDKDGNVIEVHGDEEFNGERNYLYDIAKFDLVEYGKFCESENFTMGEADDILFVGFWRKDGVYEKADEGRRNGLNVFGDEIVPTMLCQDEGKYVAVKDIILKLKGIEVDGETMEYILRQVGMEEQMLKQLFAQSTNDEIDYLHDVRNGKG